MANEKKTRKIWPNLLRSRTDKIEHVADAELESLTTDCTPDVDQTPIAQIQAEGTLLSAQQQKREKRIMSIFKKRPNDGTTNDNHITDVVLYGVILMAITAVVAGLLGFINAQTSDIILNYEDEKRQAALTEICPSADEFILSTEKTTADFVIADDNVKEVYIAYKDGTEVGYCASVTAIGYSSTPIELMVGSDLSNKVTAIKVISHSETPGIGEALISNNKDFFLNFVGHSRPIEYSTQITPVSGATFTSDGIKNGVNTALSAIDQVRLNLALAGEGSK